METPNLVAVQHGDMGDLLSPRMYPLIQNQVLPLLTAESVLVVEGGKGRGKLTSDSPGYDIIYSQLGPICRSGLRPLIHSDDAMYWSKRKEISEYLQESDNYSRAVLKFLHFQSRPDSWEELIRVIKEGRHDIKITGALSKCWQVFARELENEFTLRDDTFAEQIRLYLQEGKPVFFFGGVVHCICLTARYGWPVIRYDCTREITHSFYQAWYQVYGVAKLLNGKKDRGIS